MKFFTNLFKEEKNHNQEIIEMEKPKEMIQINVKGKLKNSVVKSHAYLHTFKIHTHYDVSVKIKETILHIESDFDFDKLSEIYRSSDAFFTLSIDDRVALNNMYSQLKNYELLREISRGENKEFMNKFKKDIMVNVDKILEDKKLEDLRNSIKTEFEIDFSFNTPLTDNTKNI